MKPTQYENPKFERIDYAAKAAELKSEGAELLACNFAQQFLTVYTRNGFIIRKRGRVFSLTMRNAAKEAENHNSSIFDVILARYGC